MEARLLQARKHSATQPAGQSSFYVHNEECGGIPVSHDLYKGMPGNCLDISPEATDFLLDILGPKGAWNGWHLLAIGRLRMGDNGTFFDVVLGRKSEAKPLLTPGTDYFEIVSSPEKAVSAPEKMISTPEKQTWW